MLRPARVAIAVNVSPGCTTYALGELELVLAGTVVLTGTIAAPPARCSTVPEISTPFTSRPLAAASESGLRPAREAIPVSVSPGWTTYAPALLAGAAGAADAVDPTSSASLSPSPVDVATPVAVAAVPEE